MNYIIILYPLSTEFSRGCDKKMCVASKTQLKSVRLPSRITPLTRSCIYYTGVMQTVNYTARLCNVPIDPVHETLRFKHDWDCFLRKAVL